MGGCDPESLVPQGWPPQEGPSAVFTEDLGPLLKPPGEHVLVCHHAGCKGLMSLEMSRGCIRHYQKGLRPGGTHGSVCSEAGPGARVVFGNVLAEKSSACALGVVGGGVCLHLAPSFSIPPGQTFWCKGVSPFFSRMVILVFGRCLLGVLREGYHLWESLLGGDSGLRVALSTGARTQSTAF